MRCLELRHGSSTARLELPDSWEIQADFQVTGGRLLSSEDVRANIELPVGTPSLSDMVRTGQKICIVVQDHTRPGPTQQTIMALLKTLGNAGVLDRDVTVLVGCGTHRIPTVQDMQCIVGSAVMERVRCLAHNYRDRDALVMVGTTHYGTPVWVNRTVAEADLVIGIGTIVPHFLAGFSGGAKTILPGVSGLETIAHNHFEVVRLANEPLYGNVTRNVVREDMEAAAKLAKLKFIVNFVPDQDGLPVHVVAGDPVAAHRHGVALARHVYSFEVNNPADVVIANSAPLDIDLNQSAKARSIGSLALGSGGSMLWLGGCQEGVGFHGLMEDCKQPTLLHDKANEEVYFYSRDLPREQLEAMYGDSVRWCMSISNAVEEIRLRHGDSACVIVLRAAPLTLVKKKGAYVT